MSVQALTSYDEVPYAARPRYATHPDCLATLARLMGMQPAPLERCRVLELGCATGGNLLPVAQALPSSRIVGLDQSRRQIEIGRQVVAELGLENLHLEARDILEVDRAFGEFDYIICHGVYSWVPQEVRDRLLRVCRENLAPQGVAYVSYNTYPGWYLRAGARDLMNFHVRGLESPAERVAQARAILEFVRCHNPEPAGAWGLALEEESAIVRSAGDHYVYHEHLEADSYPVYFQQFVAHAQGHGLQYLGEAQIHTSLAAFPQEVQKTLRGVATDLIHLEQYLDFLRNRSFRQTLLVHQEVSLQRSPGPEVVHDLWVGGLARPQSSQPDVTSTRTEEFVNEKGSTFSTSVPFTKAALVVLFENYPWPFPFDRLWAAVRERVGPAAGLLSEEQGRGLLARSLVQLYLSNLAALHTYMPPFTRTPQERPRTTALLRRQARAGTPLTNLRSREVELSVLDRAVLSLCDGNRDHEALVAELTGMVQRGELALEQEGQGVVEVAKVQAVLRGELDVSLARLAQSMVLLG